MQTGEHLVRKYDQELEAMRSRVLPAVTRNWAPEGCISAAIVHGRLA